MGGAETKTTVKTRREAVRNLPHPMFSIAIIGLNALFLLGSPLLLMLGKGSFDSAALALAFFVLPIGICYTFITHKSISKWLVAFQAICVAIWHPQPIYLLAVGIAPAYLFFGAIPRLYYRVLAVPQPDDLDLSILSAWPASTMAVMDWISEIINWLFVLGAILLFVSLFVPGMLIDTPL